MLISTTTGLTSAMQVLPQMMIPNNYYSVELPGMDLDGNEAVAVDLVWFSLSTPPGVEWRGKKVKTCRFCSVPKELTFGQMPGARFFGPIDLIIDTTGEDLLINDKEQASQDSLGKVLNNHMKGRNETSHDSV